MHRGSIKCKVKIWLWPYAAFLLCGLLFFVYILIIGVKISDALVIGVGAFGISGMLLVLREFKYITVDKPAQRLTWYSLFLPLGKTININDCSGMLQSEEYTTGGLRKTIHLVSKDMYTTLKISSIHYYNYEELIEAIALPEINSYKFNIAKYLQLLFIGQMKVEKK